MKPPSDAIFRKSDVIAGKPSRTVGVKRPRDINGEPISKVISRKPAVAVKRPLDTTVEPSSAVIVGSSDVTILPSRDAAVTKSRVRAVKSSSEVLVSNSGIIISHDNIDPSREVFIGNSVPGAAILKRSRRTNAEPSSEVAVVNSSDGTLNIVGISDVASHAAVEPSSKVVTVGSSDATLNLSDDAITNSVDVTKDHSSKPHGVTYATRSLSHNTRGKVFKKGGVVSRVGITGVVTGRSRNVERMLDNVVGSVAVIDVQGQKKAGLVKGLKVINKLVPDQKVTSFSHKPKVREEILYRMVLDPTWTNGSHRKKYIKVGLV